jgi:hypothetical protein
MQSGFSSSGDWMGAEHQALDPGRGELGRSRGAGGDCSPPMSALQIGLIAEALQRFRGMGLAERWACLPIDSAIHPILGAGEGHGGV